MNVSQEVRTQALDLAIKSFGAGGFPSPNTKALVERASAFADFLNNVDRGDG